jgi:hypothetical protein
LCRDRPECVELADKRRAFERALWGPVGRTEVEQLRIDLRKESVSGSPMGSEDRVL